MFRCAMSASTRYLAEYYMSMLSDDCEAQSTAALRLRDATRMLSY